MFFDVVWMYYEVFWLFFFLGNEILLIVCWYIGWGWENCDYIEDVGVVCKGFDRLCDCLVNCLVGYFNSFVDGSCGKCSLNCK